MTSSVFSTGSELDEIIIPSACLASDKARIEKGSEESKGAGGEDGRGKSANRALPCTICGKAQWSTVLVSWPLLGERCGYPWR
ncbi:hypothetical protein FOZ63_008059 [Perkinsus olseni]|uniref:Uncharacterized protein n=1 Tax=Perkinsus olseni TaxID=32597 RepID=A0A7J6RWZ9_PEROL|nr:hypothetical protein FOZ63_008059 [Perkinsus olseni]